eukprot:scaffold198396_cov19-Tisochrysis_lutea.AAC.1
MLRALIFAMTHGMSPDYCVRSTMQPKTWGLQAACIFALVLSSDYCMCSAKSSCLLLHGSYVWMKATVLWFCVSLLPSLILQPIGVFVCAAHVVCVFVLAAQGVSLLSFWLHSRVPQAANGTACRALCPCRPTAATLVAEPDG